MLRDKGINKNFCAWCVGFIGSAVVHQAVSAGNEVINLYALTYAACVENVAPAAGGTVYVFEKADIRDAGELISVYDMRAKNLTQ